MATIMGIIAVALVGVSAIAIFTALLTRRDS